VLGYVYGMIGNAFYDRSGARRRDNEAKIRRRRLFEHQYVNAQSVNLKLHLVYKVIFPNHALGHLRVSLYERAGRTGYSPLGSAAHDQQFIAQLVNVVFNKSVVHHLNPENHPNRPVI